MLASPLRAYRVTGAPSQRLRSARGTAAAGSTLAPAACTRSASQQVGGDHADRARLADRRRAAARSRRRLSRDAGAARARPRSTVERIGGDGGCSNTTVTSSPLRGGPALEHVDEPDHRRVPVPPPRVRTRPDHVHPVDEPAHRASKPTVSTLTPSARRTAAARRAARLAPAILLECCMRCGSRASRRGDIVEVDHNGRRFHAIVTGPAPGGLALQPTDRRVNHYIVPQPRGHRPLGQARAAARDERAAAPVAAPAADRSRAGRARPVPAVTRRSARARRNVDNCLHGRHRSRRWTRATGGSNARSCCSCSPTDSRRRCRGDSSRPSLEADSAALERALDRLSRAGVVELVGIDARASRAARRIDELGLIGV